MQTTTRNSTAVEFPPVSLIRRSMRRACSSPDAAHSLNSQTFESKMKRGKVRFRNDVCSDFHAALTGVGMDNLAKGNTSDIGLTGSTTGAGTFTGDWNADLPWWRENFRDRPYVVADRVFEYYEPAYEFATSRRTATAAGNSRTSSQPFAPTSIASRDAVSPHGTA